MKVSQGKVYKRGNVYFYDISIDGKRYQKSLRTSSRTEAYQKFSRIKSNLEIGVTPIAISSISFPELTKRYLDFAKSVKAKSSLRRDVCILKKVLDYFGDYQVVQINRQMIEGYCQKQRGEGIKPATLNREIAILKHLFKKAVEWEIIKDNPAINIKPLKVQRKAIRYLADEEIVRILNEAEGVWKDIIITFLETGIRAGELARLQWKDVELKKRILSIHHTKSYYPRYIEISDRLMKVFEELPKENSQVFPFSVDYIIHTVARICRDTGLPDVTCHIFRHTFASRLVMAGVNLRIVQALLGHADIKTTMVYSHLAPDYMCL